MNNENRRFLPTTIWDASVLKPCWLPVTKLAPFFTHTDNPGEKKAFYGSVARLAAERGIPVYAPDNVNHPLWVERIAQLSPDVIFSFIIAILFTTKFCSSLPQVHLICMVRCYQNIVVARR